MCRNTQPLVTVGMPVYNEEEFLAQSIESILAQDYNNFELIIVDNASEDGTAGICAEYARQDRRISFHRNKKNIGQYSGSKILELSSGVYHLWAAGHDLWHTNFISTLVEEMEKDSSILLCYPKSFFIDTENNIVGLIPAEIDTRGLPTIERFRKAIWDIHVGSMVYGLFRSNILKDKLWKERSVIGVDHIQVADLNILGAMAFIDKPLFFMRLKRTKATAEECWKHQIQMLQLNNKYENIIPWTIHAFEHTKIVMESTLLPDEKELLLEEVRECFTNKFFNGECLGNTIRVESMQLLEEAKKIFADNQTGDCTKLILAREFTRLAAICLFFWADFSSALLYFAELCGSDGKNICSE